MAYRAQKAVNSEAPNKFVELYKAYIVLANTVTISNSVNKSKGLTKGSNIVAERLNDIDACLDAFSKCLDRIKELLSSLPGQIATKLASHRT